MIITLKVFPYRSACYIVDGVPLPSMDVSLGDSPDFDPVTAYREEHESRRWADDLWYNEQWKCPDPASLGVLYATDSWGDTPFPHLARHASPESLLPEGFSDDYFYRYAFSYYPEAVHQLIKEDMAVGLNFRPDGSVSLMGFTTWEGDDYARSSRTPLLLISNSGDYGTLIDLYFGSLSAVLKQKGIRPFPLGADPQATSEEVTQGARQLLESILDSYPDLTLVTGSEALGYEGIPDAYKSDLSSRNADAWLSHMGIPAKRGDDRYESWDWFSQKFGYVTLDEWSRQGFGPQLQKVSPSFRSANQPPQTPREAFQGVRVPSPPVQQVAPQEPQSSGVMGSLRKFFRR